MHRALLRLTALSAAAGLATVGTAAMAVSASASAGSGVGTSEVTTSVLDVALGQQAAGPVLGLKLLTDDGRSTVDPAVNAAPQAWSKLTPLTLSSSTVGAINTVNSALAPVNGQFVSQTPGGNPHVTTVAVDLAKPVAGVTVPAGILGGTVNAADLSSGVDPAAGASSALSASVTNLSALGGLLTADTLSSKLGSDAAGTASNGTRTVNVGTIKVLNLGALLQGLGIDPAKLPVQVVSDLLAQLHATLPLPAGATSLAGAVTTLQGAITSVQALAPAGGAVTVPVDLSTLVGTLTGNTTALPTGSDPVATAAAAVTSLQSTLSGLLTSALNQVLSTSLLQLDGAQVGVTTKAAPTLAASKAAITAQLGAIHVGGISLPGVDLASTAAQVSGLVGQVNTTIQGVLGTISPNLAGLVSVSVLDQSTNVSNVKGYNQALAGITALKAVIDPSKITGGLTALVPTLQGASVAHAGSYRGAAAAPGIGSVIAANGGSVPAAAPGIPALDSSLNLPASVAALAGGPTSISVAEVTSGSQFANVAAATPTAPAASPGGTLPRTGGETTLYGGLAALLAGAALGLRRLLRRPSLG